jgi:Protein of unknown function (DUF2817)
MTSSLLLISIVAAALLAVVFQMSQVSKKDEMRDSFCELEFSTSNITGDCFFRNNYVAARELFLQSANAAGAELMFLPVVDGLGTDVAIFRGSDLGRRFLVHLSGIHGVEGYAGSAIQSATLQYLGQQFKGNGIKDDGAISNEDYPTMIFVHAVNPFGFMNNRRVNENNVDINRNFLTEQQFSDVKKRDPNYAGYTDFDSLINPTAQVSKSVLLSDAVNIFRTLLALGRHGLLALKKALVSGNYHKQEGVGFGGFEMSQSVKNLVELVQGDNLGIPDAEQIVLVDVHTGLGPEGVDTIFTNPPSALKHFATEYDYGSVAPDAGKKGAVTGGIHSGLPNNRMKESDAMSGYELTIGHTTVGFCESFLTQNLSKDKVTCMLQEIGTVSAVTVGRTMIAENYAYSHGSEAEKALYTERYRKCFYVDTRQWKRNVVRRGLKVVLQSLALLGAHPDKLPEPTFQL